MSDDDVTMAGDEGPAGISRREALRRGALVGGAVLWVTPVVQSVGMSPAAGQTTSPTPPPANCPNCPTCAASATGLSALGLTAGVASGTACQCLVNANLNAGSVGGASAQVVCGRADSPGCRASSYVEGAVVRIASNAVLEAATLGSCVSCGTGSAYVLRLFLATTALGQTTRTALTVGTGCNTAVIVPGFPGVTVVANEQTCSGGVLTVDALRVTVDGVTVVVARSRAGASGCACQPCAANPTCTPPTARLC